MSSEAASQATTPSTVPFDDGWVQWAAENRLRGCTAESMLQTMVAAGLDRALCEQALPLLEGDPVYKAALRHQQLLKKLESVLANQQKL